MCAFVHCSAKCAVTRESRSNNENHFIFLFFWLYISQRASESDSCFRFSNRNFSFFIWDNQTDGMSEGKSVLHSVFAWISPSHHAQLVQPFGCALTLALSYLNMRFSMLFSHPFFWFGLIRMLYLNTWYLYTSMLDSDVVCVWIQRSNCIFLFLFHRICKMIWAIDAFALEPVLHC